MFLILGAMAMRASCQAFILDSPHLQENIEKCLYATYACDFNEAEKLQISLLEEIPHHPAPYFLKALIIYWENFPLLPDDLLVEDFEKYIEEAIELADKIIDVSPDNLEGIFFDMHARAYRAMFWADNGKPARVIRDIDNMYRQTLKGIELKDKFEEFYFSSGLYNYYIVAYVELHPAYKPLAALFRSGDKATGLAELKYASEISTYLRYESLLFLSLLELNYEGNIDRSLEYAALLYNYFPSNIYFTTNYLITLLYSSNFTVASILNESIPVEKGDYYKMVHYMAEAFMYENQTGNFLAAKEFYLKTISKAESLGAIANIYGAIAYAGLSRIAAKENDDKLSRKYSRRSSTLSSYKFILDYPLSSAR